MNPTDYYRNEILAKIEAMKLVIDSKSSLVDAATKLGGVPA